jgi:cyclopropane fatty-acyl-phospholipid synthase-like methyltransferase
MNTIAYVGSELDLFAAATNWKNYFRSHITPYLGATVLEVGAGFGGTTRVLFNEQCKRWVSLEPDPTLFGRLTEGVTSGDLPACCEPVLGTITELSPQETFDSILYIDVLEHIKDDKEEVSRAAAHLRSGGHLIVLCPAHQWLSSPFDPSIGHHRRYNKSMYKALNPPSTKRTVLRYLDSVGMFASMSNAMVLGQSLPTRRQIAFWDKVLVPCSRWFDGLLAYSVGKSILGIWTRV